MLDVKDEAVGGWSRQYGGHLAHTTRGFPDEQAEVTDRDLLRDNVRVSSVHVAENVLYRHLLLGDGAAECELGHRHHLAYGAVAGDEADGGEVSGHSVTSV